MAELGSPHKRKEHGTSAVSSPKKAALHAPAPLPFEVAHNFFTKSLVADVLEAEPSRAIVILEHSKTVDEGLQELAHHKILSAPVCLSASVEDDDSGTFLGVLDVGAILGRVMKAIDERKSSSAGSTALESKWHQLTEAGTEFCARKLISVADELDVGLMFKAFDKTPVHELLAQAFLHPDGTHVHRVVLFDSYGRPVRVVSQSDVIRFIHKHMDKLGDFQHRTVAELGLGSGNVVTVNESASAGDAFHLMEQRKVTSVGIVNEQGKLVGNLSASDLRCLTAKDFTRFVLPAVSFKKDQADTKLVTVTRATTLARLLKDLTTHHIHRVYEVDEQGKPLLIITLTDIIRLVARI